MWISALQNHAIHPVLCLIRGSGPCPSLLQSPFIFFHLATGSDFPKVPPLDLFLHIFQQPELPTQHSHCQAPSPAPRMFMCLGVDIPEQTFNSHFGMVSSRARRHAPAPLQLQCWGKELPSPTCSPSSAGSPDLFICARSRCMEREAQEMPHRNSLTGHSPLQRHFGELQTHRKNQCQCSSSSRCRKQTPKRCVLGDSLAAGVSAQPHSWQPAWMGPAALFYFSPWYSCLC